MRTATMAMNVVADGTKRSGMNGRWKWSPKYPARARSPAAESACRKRSTPTMARTTPRTYASPVSFAHRRRNAGTPLPPRHDARDRRRPSVLADGHLQLERARFGVVRDVTRHVLDRRAPALD